MKTYNAIYLSTRNMLRQNGVEGYALEARILVACAAGKTVQQLLRDINLYTTEQVENTVLDYTARPGEVADPCYTGHFEETWQDVLDGCRGLLRAVSDQKLPQDSE